MGADAAAARPPDWAPEQRDALGVEFAVGRYVGPGTVRRSRTTDRGQLRGRADQVHPLQAAREGRPTRATGWRSVSAARSSRRPNARGWTSLPAEARRPASIPSRTSPPSEGTATARPRQRRTLQRDGGDRDGLGTACATKAPLVFLNACEVGRATPSLVGAVVRERVHQGRRRGVIAPIWSVKDSSRTRSRPPLDQSCPGPAAATVRGHPQGHPRESYAEGGGEDTYAAYCFYGDPLTSLQPPD